MLVRYDVTSSPLEVHISIVPEIIEVLKEVDSSSLNNNQPVCSEESKVGNVLRLLTLKGGVDDRSRVYTVDELLSREFCTSQLLTIVASHLKSGVDESCSRCCAFPSLQNLLSGLFLPGRLWENYVLTKRCLNKQIFRGDHHF